MTTKPSFFASITKEKRLLALINYLLLFFMVTTFGFSAVIVLIIATFAEPKAADWLKSHYVYQMRTFWIGIGPILLTSFLGLYMQRNHIVQPMVTYGLVLVPLIWVAGRVVIGFNNLFHSRAMPNPKSFLI